MNENVVILWKETPLIVGEDGLQWRFRRTCVLGVGTKDDLKLEELEHQIHFLLRNFRLVCLEKKWDG